MRYLDDKKRELLARVILGCSCIMLLTVAGYRLLVKPPVSGPETWAEVPQSLEDVAAPSFTVQTIDGDTVVLPRPSESSLLIAYSTTCQFCRMSLASWRPIAAAVCHEVQIVLVSAEPASLQRDYWQTMPRLEPVGCKPSIIGHLLDISQFVADYSVRGTPAHYVIDDSGRVVRLWQGSAARSAAVESMILAFGPRQ